MVEGADGTLYTGYPYKQGPTKPGVEHQRYSFHPCSIIYRDCDNVGITIDNP